MPKASEIKKNMALDYNGGTYMVKDIERSAPQGQSVPDADVRCGDRPQD